MKTFDIRQQYASIAYVRSGQKLRFPCPLGRYQSATIVDAIRQAAKDWKIPALLLHATLVVEEA